MALTGLRLPQNSPCSPLESPTLKPDPPPPSTLLHFNTLQSPIPGTGAHEVSGLHVNAGGGGGGVVGRGGSGQGLGCLEFVWLRVKLVKLVMLKP